MARPVVGVAAAVRPARFGPWHQEVAIVPANMVTAMHELGWLALLLTPDAALVAEPAEVVRLLDGLIVPDWGESSDRWAEFFRGLGTSAQVLGLPVLRLAASLTAPDSTVPDYVRAIGDLFTPESRAASGQPS